MDMYTNDILFQSEETNKQTNKRYLSKIEKFVTIIQLLCFWTLVIVLFLFKTRKFQRLLSLVSVYKYES